MPVRIVHPAPIPRSPELGIELEREFKIDLITGKATGFYGGLTGLPNPASLPGLGGPLAVGDSKPFSIQMTAADIEQIIRLVLSRSGMPGTVRVDV